MIILYFICMCITRQGCVKSCIKYQLSILAWSKTYYPLEFNCTIMSVRKYSIGVGSSRFLAFTKGKEKFSNLDFSGLYPYRTDSDLVKAIATKN